MSDRDRVLVYLLAVAILLAPLGARDMAVLRAYLRQWIMADRWWEDAELRRLRDRIDHIATREDIAQWLADALDIGIDPL